VESSVTIPPEAYVLITGAYTISYAVEAKITFAGIKTISYSDVNEVKDKAKRELFKKFKRLNLDMPVFISYATNKYI
jgi:cell division protein FtsA